MARLVLFIACLVPLAAAAADIEPGSWEMSVTSSFEGMPGQIGPVVQTRCFTAADVRDPHRVLESAATSGCEFTNRRDSGSEFTFDLKCSGQIPMSGSGRVTYTRTTLEAEMLLTGAANGQKFATRSRVSGRRLGSC
jgi:uncharacterized protein DUF3617